MRPMAPLSVPGPALDPGSGVNDPDTETAVEVDVSDELDTTTAPGAGVPDSDAGPVAYEIVFDCRDRMLGARLAHRLEDAATKDDWTIAATEEGPTWALTLEFPDRAHADVFFRGEFYRQYCIEIRRSCRSSVLVVPLGSR